MSNYNFINFENNKISVLIDNNKIIWFNAKQICKSLKYKEHKKAINKNVDKIDKIQLQNININIEIQQHPHTTYINESGLYSLLIGSRTKKAKKFLKWITNDVLPLMRQYNIYPQDIEITKLLKKINELEKQNKILKHDLKVEQFPEGAMVYITEEYDIDGNIMYKLGKTDNMNKRIKVHNTHTIHNKKVIYHIELECPLQLETCIRSMLYKYRYKNNKDIYNCTLNKIKKAFETCIDSIKCINEQDGGSYYKITYFDNLLKKIYSNMTISKID
jgi:prophage antirepressor-like protein